jgi:hypothetical protein
MTTITKNTKIKYKKPKNNRRFQIKDSEVINEVMQVAIVLQNDLKTEDSETMEVDTAFLHDLCSCFMAMYHKILEENLILTGNPVGDQTIH